MLFGKFLNIGRSKWVKKLDQMQVTNEKIIAEQFMTDQADQYEFPSFFTNKSLPGCEIIVNKN